MTFLSRLKFRGWDRCTEKALFPLAEWFRTSRKRLSCCLKSYSTLHRQTRSPEITKTPKHRCETTQKCIRSRQRIQMNAHVCQICTTSLSFYYASSFCSYSSLCGTHVGSFALVRFQSGWLVRAGRYSPPGYPFFFFWRCTRLVQISLSSTWPFRTRRRHTPVSKSTYVTSFCYAKAVLKISRSRGMFWIFQDKDRFRFCFVEHEAFFWQKTLRRLRFLSLLSNISGTIVFYFSVASNWCNISANECKRRLKLELIPLLHDKSSYTTSSTKLARYKSHYLSLIKWKWQFHL